MNRVERKIRARAPLRLGLAGGGTDLSPYCDTYGGATLNTTIDRFAFATILPDTRGQVSFVADDIGLEETFTLDQPLQSSELILHQGVYERMMRDFNEDRRIPMVVKTTVDAPRGSGLGSSSALVVALVEAFRIVLDAPLGPYDVARLAYEIERIDLGLAGGRQDQYAAAFGGINFIEYLPGDRVIVNPMRLSDSVKNEVESSIVACFTGKSRASESIISEQTKGIVESAKTVDAMHHLKQMSIEMKKSLLMGDVERMAAILNESWRVKRATAAAIATPRIEELLEFGLARGALGGKVSGAGGGGFIFFIDHPEYRYGLISALNEAGAMATPIQITSRGCETWQF